MLARGILLFLCVVGARSVAAAHVWHDNQGHSMNADFLNFKNGVVFLSHAKKTIRLRFDSLCGEDQEYVREQLKSQGKSNLLPAPDPKVEPVPVDGLAPGKMAERTWTDHAGKAATGRFLGLSHGSVHLQIQGRENAIPYSRFCDDDRQYIRDVLAGTIAAEPASAPAPVATPPAAVPRATKPRALAHVSPARPVHPARIEVPRVPNSVATQPEPPDVPAPAFQWPTMPAPFVTQRRRFVPPASPAMPPNLISPPLPSTVVHRCEQCGAILPPGLTAGSNCPHCGVYLAYEKDAQGKVVASAPYWHNPYLITPGMAFLIGLGISIVRWLRRS